MSSYSPNVNFDKIVTIPAGVRYLRLFSVSVEAAEREIKLITVPR